MQSTLHKIVIVGGGAGGLELVTSLGKTLGKRHLARPTLVDGSPTHIWKPLLHEVATGALNTGEDELNYFSHSARSGYEFQYGWMSGLDRRRKVIQIAALKSVTEGYEIAGPRELEYDTLVLAVGGVSNSFGTPGVMEHCICLDTPADAEKLRKRILNTALSVVLGSAPTNKLRIGIVGGGATGVELAAEIHHIICELRNYGGNLFEEQLEITIMEGGSRILGGGVESMSKFATSQLQKRNIEVRTNCLINSVNSKGFVLKDGTQVDKDIKIWAAGIKAPDWLANLGLSVNKSNRIRVDKNLQSLDDPGVYAMGDCACTPVSPETDPIHIGSNCLPATAQVAHQQAEWLTKKLEARLKNKSCSPFLFKPQGMLVSLGSATAVGNLAAIVGPQRDYYVEGRGAKVLYASLYRMHQAVLYGWTRAGLLWVGDKLRKVAMPQLKLH